MQTFDIFEIVLRDALMSPCERYQVLAYHELGSSTSHSHFKASTLKDLSIVKLWDNKEKKTIDTIVRENEERKEFISLNGEVTYLKDFKHPSGKDMMTRIAQAIHEMACRSRGYRDMIEVICNRDTYEYLRRELMCRVAYHPRTEPNGVIQFYGAKVRVADDMPHDFLVTEIWKQEHSYMHHHCTDNVWDSFPNIIGGC